jgi:hypothetical protein
MFLKTLRVPKPLGLMRPMRPDEKGIGSGGIKCGIGDFDWLSGPHQNVHTRTTFVCRVLGRANFRGRYDRTTFLRNP